MKIISKTNLGRRVDRDKVMVADIKRKIRVPDSWREMTMVMIPKPGKDHKEIKGWRPIVLANTVGKWCEKIVAQKLGEHEHL